MQLELQEFAPVSLAPSPEIDPIAEKLWREHSTRISIDGPSLTTGRMWRLTNRGWVGHIRINDDCAVSMPPKVGLSNLFGMLNVAYKYNFKVDPGIVSVESLQEYCDELASILSKRILDRAKKGFYRTYVSRQKDLPYIRGQLNLKNHLRHSWVPYLECRFKEFTGDITDNRILAWALLLILQGGVCSQRVRPLVRKAYRETVGIASLTRFSAKDCLSLLYNRLNDDYKPLHALCRFFIEHTVPNHAAGEHGMLPFLIKMDRLYEMFVAEWLRRERIEGLDVRVHVKISYGPNDEVQYDTDILLEDSVTGEVRCVIDTKYKQPESPSHDDLNEIISYAVAHRCRHAVLVYPVNMKRSFDVQLADIRVRALSFPISGDLNEDGRSFQQTLCAGWR
jgi:5-methylcytosine-specific restriction enzyme subunit McrC